MKRFLMLVGVAVVAAAMYVAASPASQQSKGPSAKQFKALKKQVATLTKALKTVKAEAADADGFVQTCMVSANSGVLPINQFGDPQGTASGTAQGYVYGTGAGITPTNIPGAAYTTALDVDGSSPFQGIYIQGVDPSCVTAALRHHTGSGAGRLSLRVERAR
jgi:hypothetical protein